MDQLSDSGQAGAKTEIEITPAMMEAGLHAYFLNRVEDQQETMADLRDVVRSILLAGLSVRPLAR